MPSVVSSSLCTRRLDQLIFLGEMYWLSKPFVDLNRAAIRLCALIKLTPLETGPPDLLEERRLPIAILQICRKLLA
jgi:hypothetical protein